MRVGASPAYVPGPGQDRTWHTGIDTFDEVVFDDLRDHATLAA